MLADSSILLAGLLCAALGGELFVRGTVGIAAAARVPAGIIGATVAAFATSSPELSVAVSSALENESSLALGDALGSNVVNVGLVLGAALLFGSMRVEAGAVRRDVAAALAVPVVTILLAVDGMLGRRDAAVLLVLFALWLGRAVVDARRERSAAADVLGEHSLAVAVPVAAVGLALLVAAGRLIVEGATGVGRDLGLDDFVVGVVFVSVGTSAPELATTVIARLRGHDAIGLGTVLGSNVFNGALVVPVAAVISPIAIDAGEVAISIAFGVALVLATVPGPRRVLGRRRGALLLAGYVGSLVTLLLVRG